LNDLTKKVSIGHWPITLLNGLSAAVALLLPMFMSRMISAEEIGKYKIVFLYLSMVPALSFSAGIESGLFYWAPLPEKAKEKVRSAWSMAVLQSLMFFGVLVLFAPLIKPWLNWNWDLYLSFVFASLVVVCGTLYEALLISRNKIWSGAIFSAIFNTLNTFSILFSLLYFKSAISMVWAFFIITSIKISIAYYLGRKEGWIPATIDLGEARSVRHYYFPVSTSGIFDFLMNNSDRFLLSLLITPVQFATYSFGCLAIPPLQILESSVNKVMIPQLTIAMNKLDMQRAAHLYRSSLEQIMLIFVPAFFGLFIFAEPIIRLLFTDKYMESVHYLRLYSILILLSGIPFDVAARATGNGKWILKNTILMGTISLSLCALLAWRFGPFGALVAMIITLIIQKISGFRLMLRTYEWSLKEMIPTKTLLQYFALAGTLGIISEIFRNYFTRDIIWFVSCGVPFAIIYLGVIFIFKKDLFGDISFLRKKL
jgi:O-antigen/teichoic acid export membrane protein